MSSLGPNVWHWGNLELNPSTNSRASIMYGKYQVGQIPSRATHSGKYQWSSSSSTKYQVGKTLKYESTNYQVDQDHVGQVPRSSIKKGKY